MASPIVFGDSGSVGAGIGRAGSALAQVLAQSGQMKQMQMAQQAQANSDRNFLEMILGGRAGGQGMPGMQGMEVIEGQEEQFSPYGGMQQSSGFGQMSLGGLGGGGPLGHLADTDLVLLAYSGPEGGRGLAKAELERRESSRKHFEGDRDFAYKQNKSYLDNMEGIRNALPSQRRAISTMKSALASKNLGFFSGDSLADALGGWGEGFRSMEGAQFQSAIKEFLLKDIGSLTGQQNKWIEQQMMSALPHIGQSNKANEALVAGLEAKYEIDDIRTQLASQMEDAYIREMGYVPGNIGRMVDEEMRIYEEDIEGKLAMKLRKLYENDQNLSKMVNTSVMPGTPLTPEMASALVGEYGGAENARQAARQLGYDVPSADQYERWTA